MLPNVGPLELLVILAVALLVLGPKRLPDAGKSLGKAVRGFREAMDRDDEEPEPNYEPVLDESASTSETDH
jgi:sec-independent protein translocase protein TatA